MGFLGSIGKALGGAAKAVAGAATGGASNAILGAAQGAAGGGGGSNPVAQLKQTAQAGDQAKMQLAQIFQQQSQQQGGGSMAGGNQIGMA